MNTETSRFGLLELDDSPIKTVAVAAPVDVPIVSTFEDPTISQEGKARALQTHAIAARAGHILDEEDQFFATGTILAESGKQEYRSKAKLHEDMPFAKECADAFNERFAQEKREDLALTMDSLSLTPNGDILTSAVAYPVSRWALGQTLTRAKAPSGTLNVIAPTDPKVQSLPGDVASTVFNSFMEGSTGKRGKRTVNLRTRLRGDGTREIFAAVSPRYQRFDADQAIKSFLTNMHPTAKGAVSYDGKKWKLAASIMSDVEPVVGEVFQANVFITGADDGSAPVTVGTEMIRVRCINLTTLHSEVADSVRHSAKEIAERITKLCANAHDRVKEFSELWAQACQENIASQAQELGIDKVFKVLVAKKLVQVPGCDSSDMVDRLMSAWSSEPGYTRASVLNAVTRAAHENAWSSPWASQALSEQAGQLLYQQVVIAPSDFASLEIE